MTQHGERNRLGELRAVGRLWCVRTALTGLMVLGVGVIGGFRINVSRSLPLGLYRTVGDATAVERGSVVIACLPQEWAQLARRRGILGPGACDGGAYGLGKVVIAVGGDVVGLHKDGVRVNDEPLVNSRPVKYDRRGRRIPHHPWGVYTLRPEEVWLYSPYHPTGFDSRYFGPVTTQRIRWVVRPVWTGK